MALARMAWIQLGELVFLWCPPEKDTSCLSNLLVTCTMAALREDKKEGDHTFDSWGQLPGQSENETQPFPL